MTVLVFSEVRGVLERLCLLFFAFVLPLVFSTRLEDGFELPQVLAALVAASFLVLMCRGGDWARVWNANKLILLCMAGFMAAGIFSFMGLAREAFFYFPTENYLWILAPVLFLAPIGTFLEKRELYLFLVLSGVVGSLVTLFQAGGLVFPGWDTHFGGRGFATLGNPTFWAGHLLVLIPLALYLAISADLRKARWFWSGAAGLLIFSLLITQTRGAWLGFLGEMALLAFLNRRQSLVWKVLMLGIIAFLLAILAFPVLNNRAVSMAQVHNRDARGRYALWEAAWSLWKEKKWTGQGPGGFAANFSRIQYQGNPPPTHLPWTAFHAHEEYLELLCERGIDGLMAGLLLLGLLLGRRLKKSDPAVFSMASAELAVMAGLGIHALFHFPFSIVPTACATALLFNPDWDRKEVPSRGEKPLWNEPRLFSAVGLFILCGLGMGVMAQNARLHLAIDLVSGQRYGEALSLLDGDPSSVFFHYLDPRLLKQKAAALDALGREAEAASGMEKVVHAYPFDADAYAMLCGFYGKQGDEDKARAAGSRALEISPWNEQALNNLSVVDFLEGKPKEAAGLLTTLMEVQRVWGLNAKAEQTLEKINLLRNSKSRVPHR